MDEGNSFRMIHKKYLIVRFSAMGDIVLTSPVVRVLSARSGVEIHFLTKEIYRDLWKENPNITKIYTIKKEINEVISFLKNENYTAVIDLHANIRTLLLQFFLWNIPFYKMKKGSLLRWFYVQTGLKPSVPKHIVTRYIETLNFLGLKYDGKGLDFFLPDEKFWVPEKPFILFVLGAGHFTKRIPLQKWKQIAEAFKQYRIILIGGEEEVDSGNILTEQTENEVINQCGKLSILSSAFYISKAKLVITGDTGMMHIAAALRKPVISIWGGTIPEFGWLPFYPEGMNRNVSIQVENLSCRPCSRFGRSDCPKKHFRCMNDISVNRISEQGEILLKNNYS